MRDFRDDLATLDTRLEEARKYLNYEAISARANELSQEVQKPDLWNDAENAQRLTTELSRLNDDIAVIDALAASLADARAMYELASEENDDSFESEIESFISKLSGQLDALDMRSLYNDPNDERDAVCVIHGGAGGTEAQDWAEMLLRMYSRWAERHGFSIELDEATPGQEAGILSATFIVHGRYAYGSLKSEKGTHRLVRISPFDSAARRHTSFASVDVIPFFEDVGDVEIDEKDLRVDTFRASGAGGQHINKTDSAIRITHIPSGIVVACQNERSQHQNRARAMQILAARLADLEQQKRAEELAKISGEKVLAGWGTQIRSYVMAPYQMVKDLRTSYETGNVQAVLDGDLDAIMESYLRWRRAGQ